MKKRGRRPLFSSRRLRLRLIFRRLSGEARKEYNVRYRADELAVLENGTCRHECGG